MPLEEKVINELKRKFRLKRVTDKMQKRDPKNGYIIEHEGEKYITTRITNFTGTKYFFTPYSEIMEKMEKK